MSDKERVALAESPDFEALADFGHLDVKEHPVLYHYCDLTAFLSIVQNRTLRLSDINTLNDFGEMHWAYERLMEAASAIISDVGRDYLDAFDAVVSGLQTHTLPVLSCFSIDGDVLSQWRAYADDGRGVAIGLDSAKLKELSVSCRKIVYDEREQVEHLKKTLLTGYPMWKLGASDPSLAATFRNFAFDCAVGLCFLKNPAFAEEQEVRLLRALAVSQKDGLWHLTDEGGSSRDKPSRRRQPIQYRARNGGVVAYVDLPLLGLGDELVKEVVLGPKSMNNGNEISMALTGCGFRGFSIRHSKATYR